MKIWKKIKGKIGNNKGESLSEVLVAVLISVLGMVLLASMITSSANMITTSRKTMQAYIAAENELVEKKSETSGVEQGTKTLTANMNLTDLRGHEIEVDYRMNTVIGSKKVITYKLKEADTSGSGD